MQESDHSILVRFRGNQTNPNYRAVTHLLRNYVTHLGGILEVVTEGEKGIDIYWDCGQEITDPSARLLIPGRSEAKAELDCKKTDDGYPVPKLEVFRGSKGEVVVKAGEFALRQEGLTGLAGGKLISDWDLFSFCADILFRRADYLPTQTVQAREAICLGQWDEAFGLREEPWVDRWMFRLLSALPQLQGPIEALPLKASVWLTHDLDNMAKWRVRSVLGQILRAPKQLVLGRFNTFGKAWREIAKWAFTGQDPYATEDLILELEKGRRATNFFLANGKDHLFHRYDIAKPRFLKVLKSYQSAGMEVGLHGQVHFIQDALGIKAEKEKLQRLVEAPVVLNRQHYLRWDPKLTFAGLEAADVKVDSTLGYNDSPGFRTGTAIPYLWFDCAKDRPTSLLEVPLILAEFQIYNPQNLDKVKASQIIGKYLEVTRRQGGVFTTLFHAEYFYENDFPGNGAVYQDLLAKVREMGLPDFDALKYHARYLSMHAE